VATLIFSYVERGINVLGRLLKPLQAQQSSETSKPKEEN
jgi:hypothetical protein